MITDAVPAGAEAVASLARQIGTTRLSRAIADVSSARRSEAADTVARLRAELAAAETPWPASHPAHAPEHDVCHAL